MLSNFTHRTLEGQLEVSLSVYVTSNVLPAKIIVAKPVKVIDARQAFIDYAGLTVPIVNQHTGEILLEAQMFVAVLGASSFTYAEASPSQKLPDWLQSHVRMFEFFGCVVEMLVPDNLRSAVSHPCRYDPQTNPSYQQLAAHYGVAVMPARPYKPKDKSKAEVGVQIVERWSMMRLRHHTFFSLAELNYCIRALLEELNNRPFKQLPGNRREAFESIDRPALKPLPAQPYRYVEIKTVKVNIDYHVQFDKHLYSVPHHYVGEKLESHAGETLIQIYFKGNPIASHPRIVGFGMSTTDAHMPARDTTINKSGHPTGCCDGPAILAPTPKPGFSINSMLEIILNRPIVFVLDCSIYRVPILPHELIMPASLPTTKACSTSSKSNLFSSPIAINSRNNLNFKLASFHKITKTFVVLNTSN